MRRQIASAIDFGTSKIICIIGEQKDNGNLEILAYGQSNYDGIRKGKFVCEEKIGFAIEEAIEKVQQQVHMRLKKTVVGVPGAFVRTGVVEGQIAPHGLHGRVDEHDMQLAIEKAKDISVPNGLRLLHAVGKEYKTQNSDWVDSPIGQRADRLWARVSCVFGLESFVNVVQPMFDSLQIDVHDYFAVPQAQVMHIIPKMYRREETILIDVGAWNTDVCVAKNDALSFHSAISVGGESITNDLVEGLGVSVEQALQLKKRYVFGLDTKNSSSIEILSNAHNDSIEKVPYEKVKMIIESRAEEICSLAAKRLMKSKVSLNDSSKIYLTGGGLLPMRGSREFVKWRMGLDAKAYSMQSSLMHSQCYSSSISLINCVFNEGKKLPDEQYSIGNGGFVNKIIRMLKNSRG